MNIEEQLLGEILDGVLAPGLKINISSLKKRYGVSLAPLREALSRLVSRGIVDFEINKGFKVPEVNEQELRDLYEINFHLEALALEQAIDRGDAQWEEEIVSSLFQLDKAEKKEPLPDFETWREADRRFHDALIGACSPVLKELRSHSHLKTARYVRIAFGNALRDMPCYSHEHKELADAVLKRDKSRAVSLMKGHFSSGRDLVLEKFIQKERGQ